MRLVSLLVLLLAASAAPHETWLMPAEFYLSAGCSMRFDVSSGMDFPNVEFPIDPSRISEATCRINGKKTTLDNFSVSERSLTFLHEFSENGVATIWLQLKPRQITLSDDDVEHYFTEIGATEEIRALWMRQRGRKPWYETYTKCMKTFVKVGDGQDSSWVLPVGLELELVPQDDPFKAVVGKDFSVRLLFKGEPLKGFPVGIICLRREFVHTDSNGVARFKLKCPGKTLFFAVYLRSAENWQSTFTTMTIDVK
ncbi:MAG: DUF4198 domain-containing protein [Acidobacteriota bacterium]|nr:DUF4198 domain-containing protein [Blastocatellia bacterium]MDW8412845.1 DUF4198 domain-containing protein [Acidobacteriota bacterium]